MQGSRGIVALAFLAACGGGEDSFLDGRVVAADQSGLVGEHVSLDIPPSSNVSSTDSTTNGRYRLTIPGDTPDEMDITFSHSARGVDDWGQIIVLRTAVSDLGDFPHWPWNLAVSEAGDARMISWDGVPSWFGSDFLAYTVAITLPGTLTSLWSGSAETPGVSIDGRFLQDQSGGVSVSAHATLGQEPSDGLPVFQYFWFGVDPAATPIQGTSFPPVSRGLGCELNGIALAAADCPITDGDFATFVGQDCPEAGCFADDVLTATVDLGATMPVSALTLHNVVWPGAQTNTIRAQTSTDCTMFTDVAADDITENNAGAYALLEWTTADARCVRLWFTTPINHLAEIGVW